MMKSEIYTIRVLTNMHVGTGDNGYGLVDNTVQRDVITNYPAIYSSSLKGALREYCKNNYNNEEKKNLINEVFGKKKTEKSEDNSSGKDKFFQANLLSIPVRGEDKPFYMATSYQIIKEVIEALEIYKDYKEDKIWKILEGNTTIYFTNSEVEDINVEGKKIDNIKAKDLDILNKIFKKDIIVYDNKTFANIVQELPVIARNCLDNGESKNLWYEEVVPRETRFYFPMIFGSEHKDDFDKLLKSGKIQIGANASIGYGYTEICPLGGLKNE